MNNLLKKTIMPLSIGLLAMSQMPNAASANGTTISPDGFREIKVAPGLAQADQLIDTVRPFLLNHPESLEGRASVDLSVRKGDNGFVVNIIKDGYLDDSVRGEHFRGFVIRNALGKWELLSMSVKNLCYRGKSANGQCK